jgi:hypothetical protein
MEAANAAPLNKDELEKADNKIDEAIAKGADADAIKRLISLSGIQYERALPPAAKDLGIPAGRLDRLVKAVRLA